MIGRPRYDPKATQQGRTAPRNTRGSGATAPQALYAMVLAIASWAVCPLVGALFALRFAGVAAREIEASDGELDGLRMVSVARGIAIANVIGTLTFLAIFLGPKVMGLSL